MKFASLNLPSAAMLLKNSWVEGCSNVDPNPAQAFFCRHGATVQFSVIDAARHSFASAMNRAISSGTKLPPKEIAESAQNDTLGWEAAC